MSKYTILSLWGLRELLSSNSERISSPDGNRLMVVSNGFLGGNLFYDHKAQKVYGICLKEIAGPSEEYIDQCEGEYALEQIPYNMNRKEAIEFLKNKGKWS